MRNIKKYINKVNIFLGILIVVLSALLLCSFKMNFEVLKEYGLPIEGKPDTVELKSGDKLDVNINSYFNKMEGIKFTTSDELLKLKKDTVYVSVYDYKNKLIYYNDLVNINHIGKEYLVKFDVIKNYKDKKLHMIIDYKNSSSKYKIGFDKFSEDIDFIETKYNDKKIDSLSLVEVGYMQTFFYKTLFTVLLFIVLFIFFRYNFKDNNKLKEKILNIKNTVIFEFIFSILAAFSLLKVFNIYRYMESSYLKEYLLFMISTIIVLFILAIYLGDKKLKREQLFLLLAIPIGIMFLAFMIPLQVPDEIYHYKIAYKVSNFNFLSFNTMIPSINQDYFKNYSEFFKHFNDINYHNLISVKAGIYHPLLYLFSGLGIFVARCLGLSPIMGMYVGCMFNFIIYLVIGYIVVKKIPFGKLLMIVYLLNPMFLQQATSFSADAMINIFSILFISYILYIKYDKKNIDTKDLIVILGSLTFVLIGKYAYFAFALLLILIRKELKQYLKKNKKMFFTLLGITLTVFVGWFIYTKILPSINGHTILKGNLLYNKPQTEVSKLQYFISNPFRFVPIYFSTLVDYTGSYVMTFLGSSLGALCIDVSTLNILIYAIVLLLSVYAEKSDYNIDKKTKIIGMVVFLITFNIILLGLYIGWGVITATAIVGVQGRYFIPIAILLLILLISKNNWIKIKNFDYIISLILIVNSIFIIKDIITYFLV